MKNKIISIDVGPYTNIDINQNAGVMWEHNATTLVFSIDDKYVGDYKYYIEYRSLIGTKVRTAYLELDAETNTITYDIPITMSSLRGVECYFNIIRINDDGQTEQVIKPRKFYLEFDYSPDTDNSIAKVNDFSINALFEAIRLGTFKGDRGEPFTYEDFTEEQLASLKGEKGDSTVVDTEMSDTSENPVQNKVVKDYIDSNKEITLITEPCNAWELENGLYKIADDSVEVCLDTDGNVICSGYIFVVDNQQRQDKELYGFGFDSVSFATGAFAICVDSEGNQKENITAGYLASQGYVDNLVNDQHPAWKKVEDVTLTENISRFSVPENKLRRFKEICIEAEIEFDDKTVTNQTVICGKGDNNRWTADVSAENKAYFVMNISRSADRMRTYFNGTLSSYGNALSGASFTAIGDSPDTKQPSQYVFSSNDTTLWLQTTENNPMAPGTVIKVWGR